MSPAVAARAAAFAVAAALALALAIDMARMPVQASDSLEEILDAQESPSVAASFQSAMGLTAYLRPLRIAQIKALFDLSQGHYRLAYRGFHALLIIALVWLFARSLGVESGRDAAAAIVALTVLTGQHVFLPFLREAFPINHFLEIAVLALAALNLSLSRGGWWADALAAITFIIAVLTLESGMLVWVIAVTAWLCGLRGVSTRGVVVMTLLLGGYFLLRFSYLETGLPALTERGAGYFLERLEPSDIQRRFGDSPIVFYAYNVAASVSSVLFAEPRDGLFVAARAWMNNDVRPHSYLTVGSSLAMTALIVAAAIWRWRRGGPVGRAERVAAVAAVVVAANAVLSFSYVKDDIMALGGVFYALAAYAAVRTAIEYAQSGGLVRATAVSLVLLALAIPWAIRSSGVHHVVNEHAFRTRNDWATLPIKWKNEGRWPDDPRQLMLIETLRNDAISSRVPNPNLAPEWRERWYGD
jgi:hypothetical protein